MNNSFQEKVWDLTKQIPKGKVTTYKEIGKAMNAKAYRAIGTALKNNPYAPFVPCHRVVKSNGKIGGYKGRLDSKEKTQMLKKEGIDIINKKIKDFDKKLFMFTFSS